MKKTVFFGPFIGEFGWELLFWHGWVKRLMRTRYKDYHKIVSSFPGRYPFYPDADEFWPLPDDFLKIKYSARNYITDYWINNLPRPNIEADLINIWPIIEKIIADFNKKLPKDAEIIHPWSFRYDKEDEKYYGVKIENFPFPKSDKDFIINSIPWTKQILEPLNPTLKGEEILRKILALDKKIIALFPRGRLYRRPDKNWAKQKYQGLIDLIKNDLPDYKIVILGEPGGAFFEDGVPEGCIDLINIDSKYRMDVQLALLKKADLAVGGQSGGVSFAMAAGCKTLVWGAPENERTFRKENYNNSPLIFLLDADPSVFLAMKYLKWFLNKSSMPLDNIKRNLKLIFYRIFNPNYFLKLRKLNEKKGN